MKIIRYILIFSICVLTLQCGDDPFIDNNTSGPVTTGVLEIDFKLPYVPLPASRIHRVDLSIARSADSLYKGKFISSANVSDARSIYRFVLEPGSYYYQAAITCSCQADSCLWGGFPGGQWGKRWAIDQVNVIKGEVIRESPSFQ
jgi:hypothetical protein